MRFTTINAKNPQSKKTQILPLSQLASIWKQVPALDPVHLATWDCLPAPALEAKPPNCGHFQELSGTKPVSKHSLSTQQWFCHWTLCESRKYSHSFWQPYHSRPGTICGITPDHLTNSLPDTFLQYLNQEHRSQSGNKKHFNTSARQKGCSFSGKLYSTISMLSSHKSWSPWTLWALDLVLLAPHLKITTRPGQIQFQAVLWRPVKASLDQPYPGRWATQIRKIKWAQK